MIHPCRFKPPSAGMVCVQQQMTVTGVPRKYFPSTPRTQSGLSCSQTLRLSQAFSFAPCTAPGTLQALLGLHLAIYEVKDLNAMIPSLLAFLHEAEELWTRQ